MNFLRIFIWSVSLYFWEFHSVCPQKTRPRKRAHLDGDIIIGALFSIHTQPTIRSAYSRQCGSVREQYGIHRVEVFTKTIEKINLDPDILPNITLGVDIRDTCWYAPIALEQSIDFIRNSLANLDRSTRSKTDNKTSSPHCDSLTGGKPIASLIGPASSSVTIQVQNLLQLFKIPQIGYSATSSDLSKKDEYSYFLRVVPSDNFQAKCLRDLLVHYKWNYVSLVSSSGNYGSRGMQNFKRHLEETPICTDKEEKIDSKEEIYAFKKLAVSLFNRTNPARVVVCFCEGEAVKMLFQAMEELEFTNKGFVIIGSDGWADRRDILGKLVDSVTKRYELSNAYIGGISIRLQSPNVPDFDTYFKGLTPDNINNERNPWFKEFWEQKFNCMLDPKKYGRPSYQAENTGSKLCTGKESLANVDYTQDTKLGFVVNAVYTVALGLNNMQRQVCKGKPGACPEFLPVNGSILLDHLLNVSFMTYANESLKFDRQGDPPGRYDIMNYQLINESGTMVYDYRPVGSWVDDSLSMNDNIIQWPRENGIRLSNVMSMCSHPCEIGFIKVISDKKRRCCWKCKECADDEIVVLQTEEQCQSCPSDSKPSKNREKCEPIEVEHINWSDSLAIVAMVLACLGVLCTCMVIGVLAWHNNTAIVKASTRELMYIILVGIILCYSTSFVLIAQPSRVSCTISRIMPGLSFSLMYGALVTKTNRISRILAGSKKKIMTRKPRFLSTLSQIVITIIINIIECAIEVAMLILEPAKEGKHVRNGRVFLICTTTTRGVIVPLGFDAVLICLCTWYAIKTRNLPENFNEAKFIGFTMYTTCIIWISLVPIYFGSENKVISMCIAMSLSSTVALVLLFCPKVYIIIFKPEKNNRSAFTTSKEIRCHFGSGQTPRTQSGKKFEAAANTIRQQRSIITRWPNASPLHNSTPASKSALATLVNNTVGIRRPVQEEEEHEMDENDSDFQKKGVEIECQTDDELVLSFVPIIRRRFQCADKSCQGLYAQGNPKTSGAGYRKSIPNHSSTINNPYAGDHIAENVRDVSHVLEEVDEVENDPLLGDTGTDGNSTVRPGGESVRVWIHSKGEPNFSPRTGDSEDIQPQWLDEYNQRSKSPSPEHSKAIQISNLPHSQTMNSFLSNQPSSVDFDDHPDPHSRRAKSLSPTLGSVPEINWSAGMTIANPSASGSQCIRSGSSSSCQTEDNPQISMEDMSVLGLQLLDEEENAADRFQHYLRSRGVEVDLDSVQISEV